ncbi:MAG: hypothetical protein JNJ83_24070 [Verrucomicrobiaceae bacterium]|nr:hypothetical protein [Verrucomicrobiaceae bacterium]
MKAILVVGTIIGLCAASAWAGQGPAGTAGVCQQVIGPVGVDGKPIGFTCTDVGGNALLVWNASRLTGNIEVQGQFKTVNFFGGSFSIDGTFTSNGPIAFIGGQIAVSGEISGTDVLIAGTATTEDGIKSSLLGPGGRILADSTARVVINKGATVTAKGGNVVIVGASFLNEGKVSANSGTVAVKTGSRLDVGWRDANWLDGTHNPNRVGQFRAINNTGTIQGKDVLLEARRDVGDFDSIVNGSGGKIIASTSVTFVTGEPGKLQPNGEYIKRSFGINNATGKLFSPKVVISPYYQAGVGGASQDREFATGSEADRSWLMHAVGGVSGPTQDNTPAGATSVINDTITPTSRVAATTAIVIPQIAPSVSHMNSTTNNRTAIAVASNSQDTVRGGSGTNTTVASKKPRVKAKPVLVRGAFFSSKISAKITANR